MDIYDEQQWVSAEASGVSVAHVPRLIHLLADGHRFQALEANTGQLRELVLRNGQHYPKIEALMVQDEIGAFIPLTGLRTLGKFLIPAATSDMYQKALQAARTQKLKSGTATLVTQLKGIANSPYAPAVGDLVQHFASDPDAWSTSVIVLYVLSYKEKQQLESHLAYDEQMDVVLAAPDSDGDLRFQLANSAKLRKIGTVYEADVGFDAEEAALVVRRVMNPTWMDRLDR